MTNQQIAASFGLLAKLMDLHEENRFKIRSYQSVADSLGKIAEPLADLEKSQLLQLKGVGEAIADKIQQLVSTGQMRTLERFREKTPEGIVKMLGIKGLGPSKIRSAWRELGVESAVDLAYACEENRLIDLKGFGKKSQQEVLEKLQFHLNHQGWHLYARIEKIIDEVSALLAAHAEIERIEVTGDARRKMPLLESVDFLVSTTASMQQLIEGLPDCSDVHGDAPVICLYKQSVMLRFFEATKSEFGYRWLVTTGPESFCKGLASRADLAEEEVLQAQGRSYWPPVARDSYKPDSSIPTLVSEADLQGLIHVHSTYSDGVDSLEDLQKEAHAKGFSYLGITDHSRVAVFANGLNEGRVRVQWQEIDDLNSGSDCRLLKGIECDILNDGSLDYDDEFRSGFEFVIASIHTNLRMDVNKATDRILQAIRHPHTNILGHPTGRLLLGREGYPLDFARVIKTCADHQVAIEINANPYRLDLDWTWIEFAVKSGCLLSINPDAHSRMAIQHIEFGITMAQKGLLTADHTLNAKSCSEFLAFCQK